MYKVYENKAMRIFGSRRKEVMGGWWKFMSFTAHILFV